MNLAQREIDEAMAYVKDTEYGTFHGEGGGPFPYRTAKAKSVASRRNRRFPGRYVAVRWLTLERAS